MHKRNINAFIFARVDSSRFPRKNLNKIQDRSLLSICYERAKLCDFEECFLLTTERDIDDDLCDHANNIGLRYIRGNSSDLTKRTEKAINETGCEYFARLNCDSPFLEPSLINFAIKNLGSANFISNIFERKFPYGIALEIVKSDFYMESISKKINEEFLEHVTKHIYNTTQRDKFFSIKQEKNQSTYQLVVDEYEHLLNIKKLTKNLNLINCHYWEILDIEKPKYIIESFAK